MRQKRISSAKYFPYSIIASLKIFYTCICAILSFYFGEAMLKINYHGLKSAIMVEM